VVLNIVELLGPRTEEDDNFELAMVGVKLRSVDTAELELVGVNSPVVTLVD
jgi:hypothetical protein